jgi:hypothetical protein
MVIVQKSDCQMEGFFLNFIVRDPNDLSRIPFGIDRIKVPPLREGEKYELRFDVLVDDYLSSNYSIYKNDNSTGEIVTESGSIALFNIGTWSMSGWVSWGLAPEFFNENRHPVPVIFINNNGRHIWYNFKVKEKGTHDIVELTKNLVWLTYAIFFLTVVQLISQLKNFWNWIRRRGLRVKLNIFGWKVR